MTDSEKIAVLARAILDLAQKAAVVTYDGGDVDISPGVIIDAKLERLLEAIIEAN